eukprot:1718462-Ditylum_brightwellii.AAC.2
MIQGDNFGSIKDTSPINLGCSRVLFWDALQQRRCAGGIASVDASNCYDQVVHNVASMSAQKWGMHTMAILCILPTISLMSFKLCTSFVQSTQSYDGNSLIPFQGLCQGNGGATGLWLCLAYLLIDYLHSEGHMIE